MPQWSAGLMTQSMRGLCGFMGAFVGVAWQCRGASCVTSRRSLGVGRCRAHRPASDLMFLRGIDTEPPRAGMTATTRESGVGRQVAMLAALVLRDSREEGGQPRTRLRDHVAGAPQKGR